MIKAVFHVHSKYSKDSVSGLEKIAQYCQKNDIKVIFLADHNNLAPSREINGVRIIGNEEIKTNEGEIIGLFIKEKIAPGLSLDETIKQIKKQGGLVAVPHPFNSLIRRWSGKKIAEHNLIKHINNVDIIEIFNARNILASDNQQALKFAEKYQKIKIVGSDAHLIREINNTYFLIENFSAPQEFLTNLAQAKFYTKTALPFHQLLSLVIKIKRWVVG